MVCDKGLVPLNITTATSTMAIGKTMSVMAMECVSLEMAMSTMAIGVTTPSRKKAMELIQTTADVNIEVHGKMAD